MARKRVLFYVQHLLGIGHLVRAGRIASALGEAFEVLMVVGGELPPGLLPADVARFALPPVRAGAAGFSALVHPDGTPFGPEDKAARRDRLLDGFDRFAPDALLIEAFPFGRRAMRFELIPLLERAAATARPPLVACSVRDILQESRPDRRAETLELIGRHFGLVLVHGDPGLTTLSDSFPEAERFAAVTAYTGMVGPSPDAVHPAAPSDGEVFDVVVSVGGGAVGAALVKAARAARPMTRFADARWLVLTGPNGGPAPTSDDPRLVFRPFVADLPARLARAQVSVSQAGYNTAADLIAARCRAVLVPYAAGGETEQTRRAALFAARGLAVTLPEADLSPLSLALAIDRAAALPEPGAAPGLDGAATTRGILARRLGL